MTDRTEPRRLELLDDDEPPPTPAQQQWIREAMRIELAEQMKPVLKTWDARSADMLDVLRDAGDARAQVRSAARTIKAASWLGVAAVLASGLLIWQVLVSERAARRAFRAAARQRRNEATQLIIDRMRVEASGINDQLRDGPCPKPSN